MHRFLFTADIEHEDFLKKRKEHYKNEVNPAMLLKGKIPADEEDEEK